MSTPTQSIIKTLQNLYKNLNHTINPQNSFILLIQIKKHTKGQNI